MRGTAAAFVAPYLAGAERQTRFVPATVRDNAFVNKEYLQTLEALTGWQRRAWLEGDWDIAAGQFFSTWRREVHVVRPFPLPAGWRVWCALDYGFTHDTVVYLLAMDGDGTIYIVDEHAARRWQIERHAAAIKAMLARWRLRVADLWTFVAGADVFARKTPGATIADEYRRHGIPLRPANDDRISGAAELLRRLGDVDSGVQPTLRVFEHCARLIGCLPALEHDPHRPEDVLKVDAGEDGTGGDDPYDALRYGCMAVWRPRVTSASVDFYGAAPLPPSARTPTRTGDDVNRLLDQADGTE